ncbi:hypothetical protein ACIP88_04980 [Streptomyces uncialis]|uniref:hypothetical protein n=1 Tax=Streptomyces uncialis TaxID=1048205 RepID=UPI003819555A
MSLIADLMSETVQIERPGPPVRDSTGSLVPGPPTRQTLTHCAIMRQDGTPVGVSVETHDASSTVVTKRVLAAPLGTDVRSADRVIHGDEVWEVEGRPMTFPLTSLARIEAPLKEVTG